MRFAKDPNNNQTISIADYVMRYGHQAIDSIITNNIPRARCPFCGGELSVVAEAARTTQHFRHLPRTICPSKSPAGAPYINLPEGQRDEDAGVELRTSFRRRWIYHFKMVNRLVPFLSPEEFVNLLRLASERRIWDYVDFNEAYIPYALVLQADFPPWTSTRREGKTQRNLWIRFWYNSDVTTINMLWNEPIDRVELYRAFFEPPTTKRGRPAYTDLIKYEEQIINLDFLNEPQPYIAQFIVDAVNNWFNERDDFPID